MVVVACFLRGRDKDLSAPGISLCVFLNKILFALLYHVSCGLLLTENKSSDDINLSVSIFVGIGVTLNKLSCLYETYYENLSETPAFPTGLTFWPPGKRRRGFASFDVSFIVSRRIERSKTHQIFIHFSHLGFSFKFPDT